MGLFSSSYKHYQSISFQPLRDQAFAEYKFAKKQIGFAVSPQPSLYGMEMWKYKHNYRKSFNKKLVQKLGAEPMLLNRSKLSYDDLRDYMENESGVADYVAILDVFDKNKSVLGETVEDPTASQIVEEYLHRDEIVKYRHYDNVDSYWFYCNNDNADKVDGTIRHKVLNEELFDDDKQAKFEYRELVYDDDGAGGVTETDNGTEEKIFNCTEYFYAKIVYMKDSGEYSREDVYIPYEYYENAIYTETDEGDMSFTPLFQLKGEDEPLEVKRDQKKLMRQFNVDLSSVQNMIDNSEIDDFRISMAFAPEDATRSSAVSKYMFEFFDSIGPELIAPRPLLGEEFNNTVHFELDGLTVDMQFAIFKESKSGTMPRGEDVSDMKVKLKQIVNNRDRYHDDVKDIYDEAIGGGETDTKLMYKAVRDAYLDDKNNETAKKFYNKLPPEDCYRTSFLTKEVYAFCDPVDLDTVLYDEMHLNIANEEDEPEWVQFWEVLSYKKTRTIKKSESELYYTTMSLADTMNVTSDRDIYPPTVEDSQMVHMNLYKKIGVNTYDVIYYRGGKIKYEVDGHPAKVYHERPNGRFRIFMTNDYLEGLSYKEYTALYDRGICGIAYCQERVKVRWYQRAGFQLFMQLTMLAITVWTAGAGSVLATAVNMAMNIAIAYVAMKIAEMIGGEAGVIIGTIVAIAAFIYLGKIDTSNMAKLWMAASDMYMKLELKHFQDEAEEMQDDYNKFKKEIDYKSKMLKEQMEGYEKQGYTKETIIKNIANRAYNDGYTDMKFDVETVEAIEDEEWKLQEVSEPEWDLSAKIYREASIPRDIVEFEDKMMVQTTFGPIQE